MFNDDKINATEMPGDLIVAANVDKSEIIHTLTEAFHLCEKCFAPVLDLCYFICLFKPPNGALKGALQKLQHLAVSLMSSKHAKSGVAIMNKSSLDPESIAVGESFEV